MPPVVQIYERYRSLIDSQTVIRLHGPDRKGMEKASKGVWNKIIDAKDDEIDAIVKMILDLQKKSVDVIVNVNNHYEGSAPKTIKKLEAALELS